MSPGYKKISWRSIFWVIFVLVLFFPREVNWAANPNQTIPTRPPSPTATRRVLPSETATNTQLIITWTSQPKVSVTTTASGSQTVTATETATITQTITQTIIVTKAIISTEAQLPTPTLKSTTLFGSSSLLLGWLIGAGVVIVGGGLFLLFWGLIRR
jgi:hypothetical protein